MLTEHNMKQNELERFNLNKYLVTSEYSRTTTSGGGVVILSGEGLSSKSLNLKKIGELTEDKLFECCLAKCKVNKWSFVLAGIYRKPQLHTLEFLSRLDRLIEVLVALKDKKNIVIAGDFNLNVLNDTSEIQNFKNILKSHGFYYLIDFPTRIALNTSTAIDNILTNIDKSLTSVTGIITALSDHDGQILELTVPTVNKLGNNFEYVECRDFSKSNMNTFKNMLSNENWLSVYLANVENKFDIFNNIFQHNFNLIFPKRMVKRYLNSKKENWINEELKLEEKEIVELSRQAKHTGSIDILNLCKLRNKEYKNKLIKAKKSFYDKQIINSENVTKKTWELINKETGKSTICMKGSIQSIKKNNHVILDPQSISNYFNYYFIDVVEEVVKNSPKNPQFSNNQNFNNQTVQHNIKTPFRCKPVNEKELRTIISCLKNKFSCGHDDVPLKVIKFVGESLLKPLVHLINCSLITGNFPDSLKLSKVVPVFKKGEKSEMGNYRPISVLPSISKIYERVMYNRLVDHLQINNLFDEQQHGFRKGKSVTSALFEFTEAIIDSIDKGDKVVGIFMDLSKAFDSISHEILLNKLNTLGIPKISLNWFRSYLFNRSQYVEIMSRKGNQKLKYKSNILTIKHGVPQGSILGPLLFLCYVQGMPSALKEIRGAGSQLILYADDSNLIMTAKNYQHLEKACEEQLKTIQNYFLDNRLLLNISKTNQILFSTVQSKNIPEISISVEDNKIEQLKIIKFLGINVDNNLSWDGHIEKIANKMSSGLYILRRMSLLCSLEPLKSIYFAHIHSHISYGLAIYGGTSKKNLDMILGFQKKALRIMLNLERKTSVKEMFSKFGILTVYDQYILNCVMCVRNQIDKLDLRSNVHSYNTRCKNNIDLRQHNLGFYTKKTTHMGSKFLNKLPAILRSKINEKGFRHLVKEYLLQKSFYSLEEFFT